MELNSNTIYSHHVEGEVLLLNITRVFTEYDTETDTGTDGETMVRYATDWDDYGPMMGHVRTDPVDDFVDRIDGVGESVTFESAL